jgi:NDP-sugar pyrophosphorylase family protein
MKAMILAAGLGTRLGPLTDDRPKALIHIAGRTLLEITISRLRAFEVREVIINVHHFADVILRYLETNNNFGMHIEVSREETLLDTGGGLKRVASFFLEGSGGMEEPFILHNVDVMSTIDLQAMAQFHTENQALATLAVQHRESSRYLLFDEQLQLCGRQRECGYPPELVRPCLQVQKLGFSGIHIISPRLFARMPEGDTFSIIALYLQLAGEGERILAFRADESYWRDLGTPDSLSRAAEDLKQKAFL